MVFGIDKMFMWLSVLGQVGDRPFTDIVYGNRNGFLTVLTEPLSRAEEPFIVRQVGLLFPLPLQYTLIHRIEAHKFA